MYVDMMPLYFYEIEEDVGVNILEGNVNTRIRETWARKNRKMLSVFKNKQTPNQTKPKPKQTPKPQTNKTQTKTFNQQKKKKNKKNPQTPEQNDKNKYETTSKTW